MDAIALARAQFAMTIMFHFIFPAITIGLGLIVATLDFAALWLAVAGASAWVTRLDHLGSDVAALLPAMTLAGGAAASLVARTRGRDGWAFVGSTLAIVALMALAAVSLYPALLPATDPARSLTVHNAASSDLTLTAMLIVALVGMPLVLAYTAFVYVRFRGVASASYL